MKLSPLLTHNGLADALKETTAEESSDTAARRAKIQENAHSAIIMCLGDSVLREVTKETTALGVWKKLEDLYLPKSVLNMLYMKQRLLGFKMTDEKNLHEQLDEFNRSVDDLENLDVKLEDEDKALALLNALPKSLEVFKDTLMFGRQSALSCDDIQTALKTKFLQSQGIKKMQTQAEGLNVKSKNGQSKYSKKKNGKFNGKKPGTGFVEKRSCYGCHKVGHIRTNCPENKKKTEN
ncbi:hypothetical protein ACS0TY_003758 [Phlomoides rotata]